MDTKRTVLFVDDEERILKSIKRIVFRKPFESIFTTSGNEALELLEDKHVDVLVTDMRMPEMSGLDLLRAVKKTHPEIARIVLSGYTQVTTLLTAINEGEIFRYIIKPWEDEDEILSAIDAGFAFHDDFLENHKTIETT